MEENGGGKEGGGWNGGDKEGGGWKGTAVIKRVGVEQNGGNNGGGGGGR